MFLGLDELGVKPVSRGHCLGRRQQMNINKCMHLLNLEVATPIPPLELPLLAVESPSSGRTASGRLRAGHR